MSIRDEMERIRAKNARIADEGELDEIEEEILEELWEEEKQKKFEPDDDDFLDESNISSNKRRRIKTKPSSTREEEDEILVEEDTEELVDDNEINASSTINGRKKAKEPIKANVGIEVLKIGNRELKIKKKSERQESRDMRERKLTINLPLDMIEVLEKLKERRFISTFADAISCALELYFEQNEF